ncbi:cupin domain-containing protein [Panacibacter ginsenosidivorans]|uniref:Cupin domain-containing protein n=1 Tax=Panacibacter ginsenosidivorans TaxID=1813871 RepID=A0A5B8VD70_9BACT|nr:cupin domain-containing protein [Panacibacter ginsenosidivorans]QEC68911.1 cupin domain-containing protein [Panacibacter ginsenosidivorans]
MSTGKVILTSNKKGTKTANSEYTFHISSYDTDGKVCLYEALFKNHQQNKSVHYHKLITETFTVLEGEFYFYLDKDEYVLGKGDSLVIPPYTIHGFRSKAPNSRVMIAFSDSRNRDDFFIELAQIVNGEMILNAEETEAFYNKYDQYNVPL